MQRKLDNSGARNARYRVVQGLMDIVTVQLRGIGYFAR